MSKEFEEVVLKKLDALDKRTKNIETEVKDTKLELKETKQGVKRLENKTNQKFTEINKKFVEVNKRLDTLFNAVVKNSEEDTAQKETANSLNKKVFNHEIRISNLENKVLTA